MRAGRLRHKISLDRQSDAKDSYGEQVDIWVTFAAVRAAMTPLSGKEYFAAGAENSEATTKFNVRYQKDLADLNSSCRLIHGDAVYDIVSVINRGARDRELIIMCKLHG